MPGRLEQLFQQPATTGGPSEAAERRQELHNVEQAGQPQGNTLQTGLEIAGGIAGGTVGAMVPLPGGAAAGATVGSNMVRIGTGLLVRSAGSALGSVGGSELAASELETPEEAVARRTGAGISGAVGEVIGSALNPVIGAVARPIKRALSGTAGESIAAGARAAQGLLAKQGSASLTPGQVRTAGFWHHLDALLRGSYSARGTMQRANNRAVDAGVAAFDKAAEQFASTLTRQELGEALGDVFTGAAKIQSANTRAAYAAVDQAIFNTGAGAAVDLSRVGANGDMARRLAVLADAGNQEAGQILRLARIGAEDPFTDFQTADAIQSTLREFGEDKNLMKGVRSLAKGLAEDVRVAMDTAGLRLGPLGQDVLTAYGTARATSKLGHDLLGNRLIMQLAKKNPEELVSAVIKNDRPSTVDAVRRVVFSPEYAAAVGNPNTLWKELQGQYIGTLKHTTGEGAFNVLDGAKLGHALDSPGGSFAKLFPDPVQRSTMRSAARAIELAQSKAEGTPFVVSLVQIGAASRLAQYAFNFGPAQPTSGAEAAFYGLVLLSPQAAAQAFTRPRVVNWLLRRAEARIDRTGQGTARAIGQFLSQLRDERIPFTFRRDNGEEFEYDGGETQQAVMKPTSKITPQ